MTVNGLVPLLPYPAEPPSHVLYGMKVACSVCGCHLGEKVYGPYDYLNDLWRRYGDRPDPLRSPFILMLVWS